MAMTYGVIRLRSARPRSHLSWPKLRLASGSTSTSRATAHAKLDDIGAVALRTVDHDAVLAARRSHAHLLRSFDQSEVRGLSFPGAWVKHSPPKRLRNASAVAAS